MSNNVRRDFVSPEGDVLASPVVFGITIDNGMSFFTVLNTVKTFDQLGIVVAVHMILTRAFHDAIPATIGSRDHLHRRGIVE